MKNSVNKITVRAFLVISVLAFGLILTTNASAQGNQKTGVSGQGALSAVTEGGDTRKRTFSVSARMNNDGTVSGVANLHNPAFTVSNGQKYQLQIDISCMKVIGNTVILGGLTKRTNDPNLVDAAFFSVQDNGEPGKDNDKISRVYFFDDDPATTGDPQLCQNYGAGDLALETIISGNINVRGQ